MRGLLSSGRLCGVHTAVSVSAAHEGANQVGKPPRRCVAAVGPPAARSPLKSALEPMPSPAPAGRNLNPRLRLCCKLEDCVVAASSPLCAAADAVVRVGRTKTSSHIAQEFLSENSGPQALVGTGPPSHLRHGDRDRRDRRNMSARRKRAPARAAEDQVTRTVFAGFSTFSSFVATIFSRPFFKDADTLSTSTSLANSMRR